MPPSSSFESTFVHRPEIALSQAEIGLRHVREVSAVLLKCATLEESHCQKVTSLLGDALGKIQGHGTGTEDAMTTLHCAMQGVLHAYLQAAKLRVDMARRFAEQVGAPLERFHKDGCARVKHLSKREKDEKSQLEAAKSALQKQRAKCLQLHESTQTAPPDTDADKQSSRLFRLAGTLGARPLTAAEAGDKLDRESEIYDEMLTATSAQQDKYFDVCLPEILSSLHCLELDRGTILSNQLRIAASELHSLANATNEEASILDGLCAAIDINKDVQSFIDDTNALIKNNTQTHTRTKSEFVYDLPVSQPSSIFRKPLEALVAANGGLEPQLLLCLTDRLRHLGALKSTEGIFRVSADKSEIMTLKRQIETRSSIPDVVSQCGSVHVLAGLIKDWLRSLPEPVIPVACYEEVLRIGSAAPAEQPALISQFWSSGAVPPPNKVVLRHLKSVVDEVSAAVEQTRMTAYNMSVCLTPCLIRPPSVIPAATLISNNRVEVAFAQALFTSDSLP
ncbi:unnamed protein product (mitochondrion) [Plasmodiophora brassicae]|uniref:Rho-GAP domain-containing protein n=1 Tax=Plasmodiophora brassicae TaxID=37360 RepID=A0A3P3Y3U6_PLABS|nr:unnamed protein product [Plasmodiophora brassicae]